MKQTLVFELRRPGARIVLPGEMAHPIAGGVQQVQARLGGLFQEAATGWLGSTRLWVHIQIGVVAGDKLEEAMKSLHSLAASGVPAPASAH